MCLDCKVLSLIPRTIWPLSTNDCSSGDPWVVESQETGLCQTQHPWKQYQVPIKKGKKQTWFAKKQLLFSEATDRWLTSMAPSIFWVLWYSMGFSEASANVAPCRSLALQRFWKWKCHWNQNSQTWHENLRDQPNQFRSSKTKELDRNQVSNPNPNLRAKISRIPPPQITVMLRTGEITSWRRKGNLLTWILKWIRCWSCLARISPQSPWICFHDDETVSGRRWKKLSKEIVVIEKSKGNDGTEKCNTDFLIKCRMTIYTIWSSRENTFARSEQLRKNEIKNKWKYMSSTKLVFQQPATSTPYNH